MLAFYTVRTTVDIVNDPVEMEKLLWAIGCLCQPEIVGTPFEEEEGKFVFRFAQRPHGLTRAGDYDFIATIGAPFTHENTTLVLAARM